MSPTLPGAQPERWGALPAYDANSEKFKRSGWSSAFDYIDAHEAVPPVEELVSGRLSELDGEWRPSSRIYCCLLFLAEVRIVAAGISLHALFLSKDIYLPVSPAVFGYGCVRGARSCADV